MSKFTRIQLRGDTLTNWNTENPVLVDKEVVLVATDSARPTEYNCKKVGDGVTTFKDLPLLGFECLSSTGTSAVFPMSQKAVTEYLDRKVDTEEYDDYSQKIISESTRRFYGIEDVTDVKEAGSYNGVPIYASNLKRFILKADNGAYYHTFTDEKYYNDSESGMALKDKLFLYSDNIYMWHEDAQTLKRVQNVVLQTLGDDPSATISQKAVTREIERINAMLSDNVGIYFRATPKIFFEGSTVTVTLDASISQEGTIKVYKEDTLIGVKENCKSYILSDVIQRGATYRVETIIEGKNYTKIARVTAVYPMYIGAAVNFMDILNDNYKQSARLTPTGTYDIKVTGKGHSVFIIVPESMSVKNVTMSGFLFPMKPYVLQNIHEVPYKIYESANRQDIGSLNLKIE